MKIEIDVADFAAQLNIKPYILDSIATCSYL